MEGARASINLSVVDEQHHLVMRKLELDLRLRASSSSRGSRSSHDMTARLGTAALVRRSRSSFFVGFCAAVCCANSDSGSDLDNVPKPVPPKCSSDPGEVGELPSACVAAGGPPAPVSALHRIRTDSNSTSTIQIAPQVHASPAAWPGAQGWIRSFSAVRAPWYLDEAERVIRIAFAQADGGDAHQSDPFVKCFEAQNHILAALDLAGPEHRVWFRAGLLVLFYSPLSEDENQLHGWGSSLLSRGMALEIEARGNINNEPAATDEDDQRHFLQQKAAEIRAWVHDVRSTAAKSKELFARVAASMQMLDQRVQAWAAGDPLAAPLRLSGAERYTDGDEDFLTPLLVRPQGRRQDAVDRSRGAPAEAPLRGSHDGSSAPTSSSGLARTSSWNSDDVQPLFASPVGVKSLKPALVDRVFTKVAPDRNLPSNSTGEQTVALAVDEELARIAKVFTEEFERMAAFERQKKDKHDTTMKTEEGMHLNLVSPLLDWGGLSDMFFQRWQDVVPMRWSSSSQKRQGREKTATSPVDPTQLLVEPRQEPRQKMAQRLKKYWSGLYGIRKRVYAILDLVRDEAYAFARKLVGDQTFASSVAAAELDAVGWAQVYLPTGGRHNVHAHQDSLVSCVFYLRSDAERTPLGLVDPRSASVLRDYEATEFRYRAEEERIENEWQPRAPFHRPHYVFTQAGDLACFPSYLTHFVGAHAESNTTRVAFAFNLQFTTRKDAWWLAATQQHGF